MDTVLVGWSAGLRVAAQEALAGTDTAMKGKVVGWVVVSPQMGYLDVHTVTMSKHEAEAYCRDWNSRIDSVEYEIAAVVMPLKRTAQREEAVKACEPRRGR